MDEITAGLIKANYKGETDTSPETLDLFSHDASMFELKPKMVVRPTDAKDVEALVKVVGDLKKKNPKLSLTARSAGTSNDLIRLNCNLLFRRDRPKAMTADFKAARGWRNMRNIDLQ